MMHHDLSCFIMLHHDAARLSGRISRRSDSLLLDGRQEVGVGIGSAGEKVGSVGCASPGVVAGETTLREVDVEIYAVAVEPDIAVVHVVLVQARVKTGRCDIKGADVKKILRCHTQSVTLVIGQLCPTHISLIATLLRTDIRITLVGHLSFIQTHE